MARLSRFWSRPWVVAAAIAAILVATLPPQPAWRQWWPSPRAHERNVQAAVERLRRRVAELSDAGTRWADSLVRVSGARRGGLTVAAYEPLTRRDAERWLDALWAQQAALYDSSAHAGAALVLLMTRSALNRAVRDQDQAGAWARYAGRPITEESRFGAGDPCLLLINVDRGEPATGGLALAPGRLAWCGLVLAHGAPGGGAREWLRGRVISWGAPWDRDDWVSRGGVRKTAWSGYWRVSSLLRLLGCREGHAESCERLARTPRLDFVWWLKERSGSEALARFWAADRPLEEAFRATYGETMGAATGRWVRERFLVSRTRPLKRTSALWLRALVVFASCAGVCAVAARRRVVAA